LRSEKNTQHKYSLKSSQTQTYTYRQTT